MAISADVLASALQDLAPGYSETFMKWHPIFEKIVARGGVQTKDLQGPYKQFTVVTQGPGSTTEVVYGSELVKGGRKQVASSGTSYAPRLIHAFDVPRKELDEANGAQDLARILEKYPELAMGEFHEQIASQLGTGAGANNLGGFLTLNGGIGNVAAGTANTYNPGGIGARNGIFEMAAPASQAGVVHALDKASVTGWENQYAASAGFATDGRRKMREVFYSCSRQGKTRGKVDLILADEASYHNYLEDLEDFVQVGSVENDHSPADVRQGVKFMDATMWLEDAIDITSTAFPLNSGRSGGTSPGVMYFLNSKTFHAYTLSGEGGGGYFKTSGPFRIPEQDLFRYEIILYMGLYCDQLRANGVITGTALA